MIFALSLPVMIGFLGLGSEVGYWYVHQRSMQTAADFGAYTAAVELRGLSEEYIAEAEAKSEAYANGAVEGEDTVTVNIPPLTGAITSDDAAEVIVSRTLPRLFSALFIDTPMTITTRAVAQFEEGGPACILALSGNAQYALDVNGNANIALTGCDVQSNSIHIEGARIDGNAKLTTGCFSSAGGYLVTDGLTLTDCTEPESGAAAANDPYKDTVFPPYTPGACQPDPHITSNQTGTIEPGHYCALSISGTATLNPGTYIIDGGDVHFGAQAEVNGAGVTIAMTNGSTLSMNGGAETHLEAPPAGEPYEGLLFYGDGVGGDVDATNKINGNSNSELEGVFYFPTQEVTFNGTNSSGPGCMLLIANTVGITGDTSFGNHCTEADHVFFGSDGGLTSAGYVRIVS